VAANVRSIFAQPDHHSATTQLHKVVRMLSPGVALVAELLEEAAEDVLEGEDPRNCSVRSPEERCWR